MTNFDVQVVSDTVCPWCYVGKQRLDKAIQEYKENHPDSKDTFTITWMPFYLNPTAPKVGVDKQKYFSERFGAARSAMMFERLAAVGRETGIAFKFGGKVGNTRDSHRLIQLGKSKSPAVQTRVVEELFRTYFENEGDITDRETLVRAGTAAGLEAGEARRWLAEGGGGAAVDAEVERAVRENVSGVPNYTVQGKYEVGGAQDSDVFLNLFEKIKASEGR